jgi:hypothetical protein
MKLLTCAAARRRIHAFHDQELSVAEQIAVAAHLEWCDDCAAMVADLRLLRRALQAAAPARVAPPTDDADVFTATVVNRMKAEQQASFFARVREMFDDMHLVYAGLGAAAATVVCVVIMLSMMRFATDERPDSLAAVVSMLATPLECEWGKDLVDASGCRERWAARFQRANETAELDALFTLESILTRQGRLASLDGIRAGRHTAATDAKLVEALLDVMSRSRFDAGTPPPLPDLAGMIWLVEHATVRANPNSKPALDLPLPPKKRAATTTRTSRVARA